MNFIHNEHVKYIESITQRYHFTHRHYSHLLKIACQSAKKNTAHSTPKNTMGRKKSIEARGYYLLNLKYPTSLFILP